MSDAVLRQSSHVFQTCLAVYPSIFLSCMFVSCPCRLSHAVSFRNVDVIYVVL
jgi:hypothetical protein